MIRLVVNVSTHDEPDLAALDRGLRLNAGWQMDHEAPFSEFSHALITLCAAAALLFPARLRAQGLPRDAFASFPDDARQVTYTNLERVRSLAIYPQLRQRLLTRQFRDFLAFLRSMGTDPDKDVDEVIFGWRGSSSGAADFFGMASGRFAPEKVGEFFTRKKLPLRHYAGADLYAFGSGGESSDFFFTFLNSSLAAFGRQSDIAAVLDARAGDRPSLESNSSFAAYEAELEDTASQWGIMSGKAAANIAAPWLGGGKEAPDLSTVLGPIQAVLFRINWDTGFSARLSVLCQTGESASALTQLLTIFRDSQRDGASSAGASPLSSVDVRADGSRVEISASGPLDALDSFTHAGSSSSAP